MKRSGVTLVLALLSIVLKAQVNLPLKHELDSIYALDQKYRAFISVKLDSARIDSLAKVYNVPKTGLTDYLWKLQTAADSSSTKRIEAIIKQYGYPGKTLVGEPTNEAVFYVLQHSTKIDQYLDVVKQAADKKELPFRLYAMMKDRSLMYNNKEQIWGTQAKGMGITDPETKKSAWKFFIWPIADQQGVNKRRKEAGFEQTVEENAKRLGLTYKVYTLTDVKNGKID
nr:DUF6624 domain-containing protein [uncultured Mucilaginibacter sp.]